MTREFIENWQALEEFLAGTKKLVMFWKEIP